MKFDKKGLTKFEIRFLEMFFNEIDDDFRFDNFWQKGWKSEPQKNCFNDTVYQGMNQLFLQLVINDRKFKSNHWATFRQANDNNYSIIKGSTGFPIQFFSIIDKKTKKIWNDEKFEEWAKNKTSEERAKRLEDKIFVEKSYTVFNAEHLISRENEKTYLENNPVNEYEEINQKIEYVEFEKKLIENMNITFEEVNNSDQAYYNPSRDIVSLPNKNQFYNEVTRLATLIHELGHATGHQSRLNRDLTGRFGTEKYAIEEFIVELNAVFMLDYLQVDYIELNNHLSYLDSWNSIISNSPKIIFNAIRTSLKIKEYMIENSN